MNQAFHLYQLQKVDTKIRAIMERVNDIDKIVNSDSRIKKAETIIKKAKQNLDKLHKDLRVSEEKGKVIRLEIEINEENLYSGNIRNPKELNDLQLKVKSDKNRFQANEEEQLGIMMQIEEKENELEKLQSLMVEIQSNVATSHALLLGEKSQLSQQKSILDTERKAKLTSISSSTYKVYTDLLNKKNWTAVSLVEERACTLCGAPLTPADWQAVRSSNDVTYCSACGRILYAS